MRVTAASKPFAPPSNRASIPRPYGATEQRGKSIAVLNRANLCPPFPVLIEMPAHGSLMMIRAANAEQITARNSFSLLFPVAGATPDAISFSL